MPELRVASQGPDCGQTTRLGNGILPQVVPQRGQIRAFTAGGAMTAELRTISCTTDHAPTYLIVHVYICMSIYSPSTSLSPPRGRLADKRKTSNKAHSSQNSFLMIVTCAYAPGRSSLQGLSWIAYETLHFGEIRRVAPRWALEFIGTICW